VYWEVAENGHLEVGEPVKGGGRVVSGLEGTVAEATPLQGKVRVLISPFGRACALDLDLVQGGELLTLVLQRKIPASFLLECAPNLL
jgi:hypothetical protein